MPRETLIMKFLGVKGHFMGCVEEMTVARLFAQWRWPPGRGLRTGHPEGCMRQESCAVA
jgi:hypothetical protein